ncbi:unnamed protein product [Acanthoscelides obtectus]|uniref:Uncharacterized protein n=1 Tax=Acanthoscelides obtectus TaxID=200917 RepID=A0A9P0PX76_ACAOB|nr:unnamed protein product [Acanthoscelides obtectus]CAK1645910.1 hypothetical protein AOBTE_LOCUS14334 [Acanthoscelides obtectus]
MSISNNFGTAARILHCISSCCYRSSNIQSNLSHLPIKKLTSTGIVGQRGSLMNSSQLKNVVYQNACNEAYLEKGR